jgi:hypothetical protein
MNPGFTAPGARRRDTGGGPGAAPLKKRGSTSAAEERTVVGLSKAKGARKRSEPRPVRNQQADRTWQSSGSPLHPGLAPQCRTATFANVAVPTSLVIGGT